jgi:hypothetical protein
MNAIPLINQLDHELGKRGFAVEEFLNYGDPTGGRYYRFAQDSARLLGCIVNANSLLFYFRDSIIRKWPELTNLIEHLDNGFMVELQDGPSYRYRIENTENLQTLVDFIDNHILPVLPASGPIRVNVTELDIKSVESGHDLSQGLQDQRFNEGLRRHVVSVAIERNPQARNACLRIHGRTCKACSITLRERYAGIEKDIIHVHHLTPISDQPGEYRIDPETDLVPVCPNCHSVIHSKYPPYTVQEIKTMLGLEQHQ